MFPILYLVIGAITWWLVEGKRYSWKNMTLRGHVIAIFLLGSLTFGGGFFLVLSPFHVVGAQLMFFATFSIFAAFGQHSLTLRVAALLAFVNFLTLVGKLDFMGFGDVLYDVAGLSADDCDSFFNFDSSANIPRCRRYLLMLSISTMISTVAQPLMAITCASASLFCNTANK